jgi:hypothetical protein
MVFRFLSKQWFTPGVIGGGYIRLTFFGYFDRFILLLFLDGYLSRSWGELFYPHWLFTGWFKGYQTFSLVANFKPPI